MANNRVVTELVVLNGDESEAEDDYSPVSATEPLPVRVIVGPGETPLLVDGNGAVVSVGNVAAGAADSGNPVKVSGKYNATLPTLDDGDRGNIQLNVRSLQMVAPTMLVGGNYVPFNAVNGVADATATGLLSIGGWFFNGATWDRQRSNSPATGLASAARTASTPTPDQTNYNGRGAKIFLDVTATPNDAQTLTVTVEEKDGVSGKYVQIASFTALVASVLTGTPTTETYEYEIAPGIAETVAAAKHELQALQLNRTWRVNVLHSAAGSWTYSVGVVNLV